MSIGGMSLPKPGATHYYAQIGLLDKGYYIFNIITFNETENHF